jgi:hypothetical protein
LKKEIKMNNPKRHGDVNQQIAKSVRPQLPRDGSSGKPANYKIGDLPYGGYQSMWNFSGNDSTKDSPTDKPGKKVY